MPQLIEDAVNGSGWHIEGLRRIHRIGSGPPIQETQIRIAPTMRKRTNDFQQFMKPVFRRLRLEEMAEGLYDHLATRIAWDRTVIHAAFGTRRRNKPCVPQLLEIGTRRTDVEIHLIRNLVDARIFPVRQQQPQKPQAMRIIQRRTYLPERICPHAHKYTKVSPIPRRLTFCKK